MAKLHIGVKSFDEVRKTLQRISTLLTTLETQTGEAGSIDNAYANVTDGTTTAVASGEDTLKVRSANALLGVTVANNESQHGDNVLLTIASDVISESDVDDTPVNGATTDPISSNWAYDHQNDDDVHDASAVNLLEVGTATYDDLQDFVNTLFSAGRISGGIITDAGSGEVNISAGTGMIKVSDAEVAEVRFCDWSAVSGQALTDNSTNHIYVRYNGGSPDVQVTTDESTIDGHDEFEIGQVYRTGTDVHIANHGPTLVNHLFHISERFYDTGDVRVSGLMISHTGTRNIAMTAGSIWAQLTKLSMGALDTSASDTFTYHYHSSGSWTMVTSQTQIDNTQYDDGTDLATLTVNRYGVHWVYLHEDGDMHIVFGQGDYKLQEAEGSTIPPGLPDIITEMGLLVGRIIIQKNAASFLEVATAFETTFGTTGVSSHNELANLQGGTTDEYYHLTSAEQTELSAWLDDVTLADGGNTTVADITANNVITAGNVDGRDVSVDGTKLDGIEALADVTDATNVAAAGAIMDGDITGNGLMIRTGAGAYTNRSVAVDDAKLTVANADGAAGNPSLGFGSVALADLSDVTAKTGSGTIVVMKTSPRLVTPVIADLSDDHRYVFAPSELTDNRTITLPLLTGNDEFTFNAHTQTLTNKTLTMPMVGDLTNMTHDHSNAANGGVLNIGIADDNLVGIDHAAVADDDYAKFTANGLEGRSYAEVKADLDLEIGTDVLAQQTIGIADDNLIEVDDADAADNDYAKFTANGLEGRSYAEVRSDINVADGADVTLTSTIAAKYRTFAKTMHEAAPLATTEIPIAYFPYAATITKVKHKTDTGTVDWQLEHRNAWADAAGEADVFAANEQSTSTGQTETSFNDATIQAGRYLVYVADSIASTPGVLDITVEYTID